MPWYYQVLWRFALNTNHMPPPYTHTLTCFQFNMPCNSLRSGGLAHIRTHNCWFCRVSRVSAVATFTFSLLKLSNQIMSLHAMSCRPSESSKCLASDPHKPVLIKQFPFTCLVLSGLLGHTFTLPYLVTHFFKIFLWQQNFWGSLSIESLSAFSCTCFILYGVIRIWLREMTAGKHWVSKRAAQHDIFS